MPETVLKKLSKAKIPVYKLKKCAAEVIFCTADEYSEKVFAIFSHPCYNVKVKRESVIKRMRRFALNRAGLIVGAALFIALAAVADGMVFSVNVTGSGSYLSPEVKQLIRSSGIDAPSSYSSLDGPLASSRIMALPGVTFCSITKRGLSLVVDVQTDEEHLSRASSRPLICGCNGTLINLVTVCGTPEKSAGDEVSRGETLIGAYYMDGEEKRECIAVGFAEILSRAKIAVSAPEASERYRRGALAAADAYGEVRERSLSVKNCDGGVVYEVDFSFVTVISINL